VTEFFTQYFETLLALQLGSANAFGSLGNLGNSLGLGGGNFPFGG
jgi:hypothetical protein